MLRLTDRWVWDFWIADTGSDYHLFYLQAPRSLGDPDLRHAHATVGHAVSANLVDWDVLPDALLAGEPGTWDDRATWTGSVILHDGLWHLFYTGCRQSEGGLVQRIGLATSPDLMTWTRHPGNPISAVDPRWYELLDLDERRDQVWRDQAWRDPWVLADPDGDGFHALITARARSGPPDARGVIGHAWSPDLVRWEARPPLSGPGEFGHMEVPQTAVVDGQPVLVFCSGGDQAGRERERRVGVMPSGTYVCPAGSPLGPFDVAGARLVSELYAGRLVRQRNGEHALMGFIGSGLDGTFVGAIADPVPVSRLAGFPGARSRI